jgi:hypothetical protein
MIYSNDKSSLIACNFSGDTDGRVPFTSTQYSINKMKLQVKTEWHPWYVKGELSFFFHHSNVFFISSPNLA